MDGKFVEVYAMQPLVPLAENVGAMYPVAATPLHMHSMILLQLHLESVVAVIKSIFSCTNLLLNLETILVCQMELAMTMH